MACPIDLSKYITQRNCTALLERGARFETTAQKVSPMFYQIYHPKTGELKGFLLGSCHNLKLMSDLSFADLPEMFESNSKVQQCFSAANTFAGELNIQDYLSKEAGYPIDLETIVKFVVEPLQSIDAAFEVHARKADKRIEALDTGEEYMEKNNLPHQNIRSLSSRTKCVREKFKPFEMGSEKAFEEYSLECDSSLERSRRAFENRNMATRASTLLQQPGLTFLMVGAERISGREGICQLLRKHGWNVQRW
jgi:hypothetical protein